METAQGALGGIFSVRVTVEEKWGKKEDFGPFQKTRNGSLRSALLSLF